MKKKSVILVGIIILVVIIVTAGYLLINNGNKCTVRHNSKCDRSCNTDNDCKKDKCFCVNVNEKILDDSRLAPGMMIGCENKGNCECINNKCEGIVVDKTNCSVAGELVYVGKKWRCCGNLIPIPKGCYNGSNDVPTAVAEICSDCGNKICESWESQCNCPGDCKNSNYGCFYNLSSCQYCNKDSDCKLDCNFCLNINENYKIPHSIAAVMGIPAPCPKGLYCFCIDNKCEAKLGKV